GFRRSRSRRKGNRNRYSRSHRFEALEDRRLLAVYTVTSNGSTPGLTLDQAIDQANGNSGHDDINFSGVSSVTLTGEPSIYDSLTIDGGSGVTIHAAANSRVFDISGADVTLKNLTLTGGNASGSGGAIYSSSANLTVQNCTVSGNSTLSNGGGIYVNGGNLTLQNNSKISNNNTSPSGQ